MKNVLFTQTRKFKNNSSNISVAQQLLRTYQILRSKSS